MADLLSVGAGFVPGSDMTGIGFTAGCGVTTGFSTNDGFVACVDAVDLISAGVNFFTGSGVARVFSTGDDLVGAVVSPARFGAAAACVEPETCPFHNDDCGN